MKKLFLALLGLSVLAPAQATKLGPIASPQGIFSKTDATQTYILQILDPLGTRNSQLIGLNVEQGLNPAGTANYFNFGQASELFTFTSNPQAFSSQNTAVYGSFNHFGSGALNSGFGASFEAFNDGPATATLLAGIAADATCGGVAAGVPTQNPTNNGSCTNIRAFDAFVRNLSSGTVGTAASIFVEAPVNSGGGSITNAYGLLIQDQLIGSNNWAIKTGAGLVEFSGNLQEDATTLFNGQVGVGVSPPSGIGVALQPHGLAQLGSNTTQTGIYVFPATTGNATAGGFGIQSRADVAVSTAQTLNVSIDGQTPSIGVGGSIVTWNGLRAEAGPIATTNLGLFIASQTLGGTNYSIFTGLGIAHLGGGVETPLAYTSTVATGTAPIVVTSTTPVTNLTVANHPKLEDCGSTSTCAKTAETNALIVRGSVAFPTASTVTVTSLPFTSSSAYSCTASDFTTAAGVINATTYTSGASVTFTETGGTNADVVRYICVGF